MKFRNRIADWLSRIACWLRGHKWYVADSWYGVPCNRPSELQQQIWLDVVCLTVGDHTPETKTMLDTIEKRLDELSQAAGANWGHIWPKDKP